VRHVENFHTAGKLGFVLCVKESSFRRSEQLGVVCAALSRYQGFPSSKRQPIRDDVVEDFPLFRTQSSGGREPRRRLASSLSASQEEALPNQKTESRQSSRAERDVVISAVSQTMLCAMTPSCSVAEIVLSRLTWA
jgi:hypothetical protein